MDRNARLGLASMGLIAGMITASFLGCYDSRTNDKGACQDDGNPCTVDECASGATVHVPKPDGDECALGNNGGKCNAGSCLLDCLTSGTCNCTADSECPTDEACATWACTMGQCTRAFASDGTLVGPLNPGDCKKEVCNAGTKNTVQDDADTPDDTVGDCQKWICENSAPKAIPDDIDTPADSQGDCKKPVCSNGMPSTANDNADEPPDTGCVNNSCINGMITAMNAAIGTQCMIGVCDSKGACVDCLSAVDYAACSACKVKKCDGEACATATECKTGSCADGVCCNTACTDQCKSCNVGAMKGTCTDIPYYQPDPKYTDQFGDPNASCSANYLCNGSGKCLGRIGGTCTNDADCLSGKCTTMTNFCLGAKDEACTSNGQCASGTCTNSKCS